MRFRSVSPVQRRPLPDDVQLYGMLADKKAEFQPILDKSERA